MSNKTAPKGRSANKLGKTPTACILEFCTGFVIFCSYKTRLSQVIDFGGAKRDRTADLNTASVTADFAYLTDSIKKITLFYKKVLYCLYQFVGVWYKSRRN